VTTTNHDTADAHVLFEQRGALGIATLNRPRALNAMTLDMYRTLAPQFEAWRVDSSIRAVLMRGAGERAFCAGGDVRAVYNAQHTPFGRDDYKTALFTEEYQFIRGLHRYPKQYITLNHGITMGGGVGLSVNGRYRIATENTVFAMPEVFIGSIPDVGATRFFNLCPGRIGLYLALTGTRIGAADAMYCGFFTHFVPLERFENLIDMLADGDVETAMARCSAKPGKSELAAVQPEIDRCFGLPSVEAVRDAVQTVDAEWARAASASMERASPASLKIVLRQLQLGAGMDLEQALTLEFRIIRHLLKEDDFYEGVRSVVIDKDRNPRWRFASLEQVSDAEVERKFESLGADELVFFARPDQAKNGD